MNFAALTLALPLLQSSQARVVERAPAVSVQVRLDPGQAWQRTVAGGTVATCRSGCAWLTHEGDQRGVVLLPGDSHRFAAATRVVAQALLPMEMELVEGR